MDSVNQIQPSYLIRSEAIDRLHSVVDDLPKYKREFVELIGNFTIDKTLTMLRVIDRDHDFKTSKYYNLYNRYFDEIEEMIFMVC